MHLRPLIAVVALSSTACFLWGSHDATPAPIDLTVRASDRLNPDDEGGSLPTMVLVYQLKSAVKLDAADFEGVYRRAKEALGEELLQVDEMEVAPGQVRTARLARDKGAKTIAVVAVVRRPSGTGWRSVVDLPPADQRASFDFALDGYRIERK
jgi:type VI secretion system protein VasD